MSIRGLVRTMRAEYRRTQAAMDAGATALEAFAGRGQCGARFEAGRSYPCVRTVGHAGSHMHPMDPVPHTGGPAASEEPSR